MFERFIVPLIQRYLSRYIHLNAEQFSSQLFYKREILIENLSFKHVNLNEDLQRIFLLPIEFESIEIDRIQCSYHLSSFFFRSSSPILNIKVENVQIKLKDRSINKPNEKNKRIELDRLEKQFDDEFSQMKSSKWNLQRFVYSYLEKIHLEIDQIHVQYQPSKLNYQIGCLIERIEIVPYQTFRIIRPSIYVDREKNLSSHSFILFPRSTVEFKDELRLTIDDLQFQFYFEQIQILIKFFNNLISSDRSKELFYRPSRWKILKFKLFQKEIEEKNKSFWFRRSICAKRLKQIFIYRQIYSKYLQKRYFRRSTLTSDDQDFLQQIQNEIPLEILLHIHQSIFEKDVREKFVSSSFLNPIESIKTIFGDFQKLFTIEIEKDIEEEIYLESMNENDFLQQENEEFKRFSFKCHFQSIRFDLIDSIEENLHLQLDFHQCLTELEYHFNPHQYFLHLFSIDQIFLHDFQAFEHSMIFSSTSSSNQFLQFKFEKKPKIKSFMDFHCGKFDLNVTRRRFVDLFRFAVENPWKSVSFSRKTNAISMKCHFDQSEMKFIDFVPKKTFQIEFSHIVISNRFENNGEEDEEFSTPPTSPNASDQNDEIETNVYRIHRIENEKVDRISMKLDDFQMNLFDENTSRSIIDKFSSRFHLQQKLIEGKFPLLNIYFDRSMIDLIEEIFHFHRSKSLIEIFQLPVKFVFDRICFHFDKQIQIDLKNIRLEKLINFQFEFYGENCDLYLLENLDEKRSFNIEIRSIETFLSFQNENFLWTKINEIQLDFRPSGEEIRRFNRQNFNVEIQLKSNNFVHIDVSPIEIDFDLKKFEILENLLEENFHFDSSFKFDVEILLKFDKIHLEIFRFQPLSSICSIDLMKSQIELIRRFSSNEIFSMKFRCENLSMIDEEFSHRSMIYPLNPIEMKFSLENQRKQIDLILRQCRIFFFIDWLMIFNEFFNEFLNERKFFSKTNFFDRFQIHFDLYQFELILISTGKNLFSDGIRLDLSGELSYRRENELNRSFEYLINDFAFSICQLISIDEKSLSIIESKTFQLNIRNSNDIERVQLEMPQIQICCSVGHLKQLGTIFRQLSKEISRAKTRKPLLTILGRMFYSQFRDVFDSEREKQLISFQSEEISIFLLEKSIFPIAKILLKPFQMKTIENHRTDRSELAEFQLEIFSFNRYSSGFEPLIEKCSMKIRIDRSEHSRSIRISTDDIFNVNLTKSSIESLKLIEKQLKHLDDEKEPTKQIRQIDSFSFENQLGVDVRCSNWIDEENFQRKEFLVRSNETISFGFSSLTNLFYPNHFRLAIEIDRFEPLDSICLDHLGKYFRLARRQENSTEILLLLIEITMTESIRRFIRIRSAIQIENHLTTSIEIQLKSFHLSDLQIRLEPNEIRSFPINYSTNLNEIRIRLADFSSEFSRTSIRFNEIQRKSKSFLCSSSFENEKSSFYLTFQSKQIPFVDPQQKKYFLYEFSIEYPLTLINSLPHRLEMLFVSHHRIFSIDPFQCLNDQQIDIRQPIEIKFSFDRFETRRSIRLSSLNELFQLKSIDERLLFVDQNQRELVLDLNIQCSTEHRLIIQLFVPFLLLNKTGIPLIFKSFHNRDEMCSGQTIDDEHRINTDGILFSFENSHRTNFCQMRVGSSLHSTTDFRPEWSQKFSFDQRTISQQLFVRSISSNSSDQIYQIAIEIRQGEKFFNKTKLIFFNSKFSITNRTSMNFLLCQHSFYRSIIRLSSSTTKSFHWNRFDDEQMLSIAIESETNEPIWSKPFRIDSTKSFHLNVRLQRQNPFILHVQIVEEHGSFFVIFFDTKQFPSPFVLSNRSAISIEIFQKDFSSFRQTIRPNETIDYVLEDSTKNSILICSIDEIIEENFDLMKLGSRPSIVYPQLKYFAFPTTSLVIDVQQNELIVAKRNPKRLSQLWFVTSRGYLIHFASSQKYFDWKNENLTKTFVLDLEVDRLSIRSYDSQRISNQLWIFDRRGYLRLQNSSFVLQSFGQFEENSRLVVTSIDDSIDEHRPICPTMFIRCQEHFNGSGKLTVEILAHEGQHRLEFRDEIPQSDENLLPTNDLSIINRIHLDFTAGLTLSIIYSDENSSEELIFGRLKNFQFYLKIHQEENSIRMTIDEIQIFNQILTTQNPNFVQIYPKDDQPAIRFGLIWPKFNSMNSVKSLRLLINRILIRFDEILLWKFIDFFDIEISSFSALILRQARRKLAKKSSSERQIELNLKNDENDRIYSFLRCSQTERIHFDEIFISSIDLNLSVFCLQSRRSISSRLLKLKRQSSFPLVQFENAEIHLKKYEDFHSTNTIHFILLSLFRHYIDGSKRQALKILGTVDFLGNPLGLIHDVTDGLNCLIDQRSVSGLVKNVTHGVANSTSKVTNSLSVGIGKFLPDQQRDQRRQSFSFDQQNRSNRITNVLKQGKSQITSSFVGGLTSMIRQPYQGAVEDGMTGFIKGVAKGMMGSVSKPIVGVLDFTNDMATAIKDGAKTTNALESSSRRLPRSPANSYHLLESYSLDQAKYFCLLQKFNGNQLSERLLQHFHLSDNLQVIISNERVLIYRIPDENNQFNGEIHQTYQFNSFFTVLPIEDEKDVGFIQFYFDRISSNEHQSRNSSSNRYRCDTFDQSVIIAKHIQRAQQMFHEEAFIYRSNNRHEH